MYNGCHLYFISLLIGTPFFLWIINISLLPQWGQSQIANRRQRWSCGQKCCNKNSINNHRHHYFVHVHLLSNYIPFFNFVFLLVLARDGE